MEWRLLAVPGVLWSFCAIAVLPGVPASFHTSGQQASPLPNTVASSDEGLRVPQRVFTTLATPPQDNLSRRRPGSANTCEPLDINGKKSECSCDVTVGSEPMDVLTTTQEEGVLYFRPGVEFRGITLELEITFGTVTEMINKDELCVRNDSVWYKICFRAAVDYAGLDRWAVETTVNTCTKSIRSRHFYSLNSFSLLRVRAKGSSCWRHSLVPECSSDDQDEKNESHQTKDPERFSSDEDSTDSPRQMNDLQRLILMVILPIMIVATIIIVVGVTLLIRKNMASQSRHVAGSCDAGGHQDDDIYENLGLEEVQVRPGQCVDRENSLYAAWTSEAGGPLAEPCNAAGQQDDAIYGNLGLEEVQVRPGQRVDRENSLYAPWTSGAGGENTPDILSVQKSDYKRPLAEPCNAAGQQDDAIYGNLGLEEVQVRPGQRVDRENSLYAPWTSGAGGENTPDILSVQKGPLTEPCNAAGQQDDAIYGNLGLEEVQVRPGQRVDRENSLYAPWT